MKLSPLFSEKQIQIKVKELAEKINHKYGTEEILAVGILKGAFIFFSDLVKLLTADTICDFCAVSFYGDSLWAGKEARFSLGLSQPVKDQHVLLIDCIADQGHSLKYTRDYILKQKPRSLTSVVLVSKPSARKLVSIDFSGFEVEQDMFLVGYGIDYKDEGRNLPYLAQLEDLN